MIEQTLVLIKPDGVQRGLIGEIIKRFEQRGLKIVGLKMVQINKDFAKKHYFDLGQRRGEEILKYNISFLSSGPVIAMVIEGSSAVDTVRKIVGATEPKAAEVGSIRGDFAHVSYELANKKKIVLKNLIHASASKKDAETELALWFSIDEIHKYKISHEDHTL